MNAFMFTHHAHFPTAIEQNVRCSLERGIYAQTTPKIQRLLHITTHILQIKSITYSSIGHCALYYLGAWRVLEKNLYNKTSSKN
jgi:hypothetical protein